MNKKIKIVFDVLLVGYAVLAVLTLAVVVLPAPRVSIDFVQPAAASRLSITTNKSDYAIGEEIKITMINGAKNPLIQSGESSIEVSADRILGGIYGVGLIEKLVDDQWIAIEPVWRCGDSCYTECGRNDFVNLEKTGDFVWHQQKLICNLEEKSEKREECGPGNYRVSSAIQGVDGGDYEIIYSNIFVIR